MNSKLVTAGIVAVLLVIGGVWFAANRQGGAPPEDTPVPASQLQNELPQTSGSSTSGDHSTA